MASCKRLGRALPQMQMRGRQRGIGPSEGRNARHLEQRVLRSVGVAEDELNSLTRKEPVSNDRHRKPPLSSYACLPDTVSGDAGLI